MIPIRPFTRVNFLRYGAYYASRLLPHPLLRRLVTFGMRASIALLNGFAVAAEGADTKAALNKLRLTGMTPVVSPLGPGQIDDVLAYLATAPVARGSPGAPVTVDSQGVSSAVYAASTIVACPHLLRAMNDPALLQIATGFLGCKPTISGVGLRWSFPDDKSAIAVERFHRDTEDWRVLRLFIYLTDVDEESGPHQFVLESHTSAGRFRLRPYTQEYIDRHFGHDKLVTLTGPRGTAFMGDMWGVHRGVPPLKRPRLLFNCTYTMTATPIYDYTPVQVADSDRYDRYTNRLLIR